MKCSICNEEIKPDISGWDKGNNAQPINNGRCCNKCNSEVVIPERLKGFIREEKKILERMKRRKK